MTNWIVSVWSATSQWVNAVIGGNPNESLSGRAYRLREHGWEWFYRVVNFLFFWQGDHCKQSHFNDVVEAELFLDDHDQYVMNRERAVEKIFDAPPTVSTEQDFFNLDVRTAEFYENNNDAMNELTPDELMSWRNWFETNDHDKIVKEYKDATLNRIWQSGTNFAFTNKLAKSINDAAKREYTRRNPSVVPDTNGMK